MKEFFLVTSILFSGCAYQVKSGHGGLHKLSNTYGEIVVVRYVLVDNSYPTDRIVGGVQGRAIEHVIKLRGTGKLIIIASHPPDGVMITDCLKITYDQKLIRKLEKVHGDYCLR